MQKTYRLLKNAMLSKARYKCSQRQLEVAICSPGGVATTALIRHVSRFIDCNREDDQDGVKHQISPASINSKKIIFIAGDPEVTIPSLERRGYLRFQHVKLGGSWWNLVRSNKNNRLGVMQKQRVQEKNFREFREKPILVIRHNELHKFGQPIAEFLGIRSESFVTDFPIYER